MTSYFDAAIVPMFQDIVNDSKHTFHDPDLYVMEFAARLLNRIEQLHINLEDIMRIDEMQVQDVDMQRLLEQLCQYYQLLAERLYEAHQKVKECANMAVRKQSLGNH